MSEHSKNVVGPQIRKIRFQKKLTQDELAARCGVIGWDISRGTLAKIEAGLRHVNDRELVDVALALRVPIEELYPPNLLRKLRKR